MDSWRDPLQTLEAYETWLGRQPLGLVQAAVSGVSELVACRPVDGKDLVEEVGELSSDPSFGPRRTHEGV